MGLLHSQYAMIPNNSTKSSHQSRKQCAEFLDLSTHDTYKEIPVSILRQDSPALEAITRRDADELYNSKGWSEHPFWGPMKPFSCSISDLVASVRSTMPHL